MSIRRYYITAAPQCVYPDASLSGVLNAASFDAVYVQFCEADPAVLLNCLISTILRQQSVRPTELRLRIKLGFRDLVRRIIRCTELTSS